MKTPEQLIAFENRIKELWETGKLPFLVHLCGGNEHHLIGIFRDIKEGDWVLSSHRSHYHALLIGVPEENLEQMIRDGRSMFVFDRSKNFLSSAILGGMCGVAAGIALAIHLEGSEAKVWCFLGDGAEDNGHLYEAVKFVESMQLPCRFVIEDNDRSCGVSRAQRGAQFNFPWPACVKRYYYTPTYPHAGSGCAHKIEFDKDIVAKFAS